MSYIIEPRDHRIVNNPVFVKLARIQELVQSWAQGYSVDLEENEIGVNDIARRIVDGLGKMSAAASVSEHSSRLSEDVMERIAPDVMNATDSIAAAIGGGKSPDNAAATSCR